METVGEQYRAIAEIIDSNDIVNSLRNNEIKPNTNDERLNGAINQAKKSIRIIDEILDPYYMK